ncbi:MerR family transcriptional regulator [Paracoccus tegillarcae]|uniref:MerR family transcriptional regulator n=1 Tax=Paracoccus tegillarcae TaxID=1529068 RepID=A0A2K9ENB3_9RHOB|nr:MerR family transcriptional regulator [Paracoccus tegillarcae]AUH32186.1 MerR family transcriptional regulator [Paracoccus tegillarcae]
MAKGAQAFRSIGEVAKMIGVAPHVLRYWETQFSLLKPMKRGDGRRYYRPDDVRLAAGLCEVLRDEGLTIRGAKKLLAKDRGETVRRRGAIKLGEALEDEGDQQVEAAQDETAATEPRVRTRKRPAPRGSDTLPLFPEEQKPAAAVAPAEVAAPKPAPVPFSPVDAAQAGWLMRLTETNAVLRKHPGGAQMSDPARAAAHRLLDTIADHF